MKLFATPICIELGESVVRVMDADRQIRKLPSMVRVNQRKGDPIASHVDVSLIKDGKIPDLEPMVQFLKQVVPQVTQTPLWIGRPMILASIPTNLPPIESLAYTKVLSTVANEEPRLVARGLAAAVGLGIDVESSGSSLILLLDENNSELSLVSNGRVVQSLPIPWSAAGINDELFALLLRDGIEGDRRELRSMLSKLRFESGEEKITFEGRLISGGGYATKDYHANVLTQFLSQYTLRNLILPLEMFSKQLEVEHIKSMIEQGFFLCGDASALVPDLDLFMAKKLHLPASILPRADEAVITGLFEIMPHILEARYERSQDAAHIIGL